MLLIHPFEDGNGRMARIVALGIASTSEERIQACAWIFAALRASQAKFIDAAFALRFGQVDALDRLVDEALFVSDSLSNESAKLDFDTALAR
jgi:fido (protein-threonine AMPylation protein)